jgi:uncharacterized protein
MADFPEGAPCWADVMVPDLEEGKRFYSELLGWTFQDSSAEYGHYTQAFSGGRNVAAVAPVPPGQQMPAAWNAYFATRDANATAARIREAGGRLPMEPMQVGEFGTMLMAEDPAGAMFGAWQAGTHKGFEKQAEPGAFAWLEIVVRDAEAADAFYPRVFPYEMRQIGDGAQMDFKTMELDGRPVAGRYRMGPEVPTGTPPHLSLYFAVENCDDAAATVQKLAGQLRREPQDSPYGRFAQVTDNQGAHFSVIDLTTTVGQPPA